MIFFQCNLEEISVVLRELTKQKDKAQSKKNVSTHTISCSLLAAHLTLSKGENGDFERF